MTTRVTLPNKDHLIAQAMCGDMYISLAYIFGSDAEMAVRGIQNDGDGPEVIFSREFTDLREALLDFAQSISDEYQG